jgi:hypothetical protein
MGKCRWAGYTTTKEPRLASKIVIPMLCCSSLVLEPDGLDARLQKGEYLVPLRFAVMVSVNPQAKVTVMGG